MLQELAAEHSVKNGADARQPQDQESVNELDVNICPEHIKERQQPINGVRRPAGRSRTTSRVRVKKRIVNSHVRSTSNLPMGIRAKPTKPVATRNRGSRLATRRWTATAMAKDKRHDRAGLPTDRTPGGADRSPPRRASYRPPRPCPDRSSRRGRLGYPAVMDNPLPSPKMPPYIIVNNRTHHHNRRDRVERDSG